MTELQQAVARAAIGALADTLAQVEQDCKNIRYLTVEVELSGSKPTAARARGERQCNVSKLLGVGRG